ncbi:hypothetical protein ACHAWF_000098, partial [Thalassiosira exigua]
MASFRGRGARPRLPFARQGGEGGRLQQRADSWRRLPLRRRGIEGAQSLCQARPPSPVDPSDVSIYLGATAGMRILDPAFEA